MIWEGALDGRSCPEQLWQATLSLHVNESKVSDSPVLRREGGSLESETQWNASCGGVLATSKPRPHAQVVHEVQQLVLLAVADDRAEHFLHEAPSDAVPSLLQLRCHRPPLPPKLRSRCHRKGPFFLLLASFRLWPSRLSRRGWYANKGVATKRIPAPAPL